MITQSPPSSSHSLSMTKPISGWTRQTVEVINPRGPWGGPSLSYRSADIECRSDGRVCGLFLAGHPMDALAIEYDIDKVVALIDVWLDVGELPY